MREPVRAKAEPATARLSPRLSTAELADELGHKPETLRGWRWRGIGPPSYKIGGKTVYDRIDVDAWIAAQKARTLVGDPAA